MSQPNPAVPKEDPNWRDKLSLPAKDTRIRTEVGLEETLCSIWAQADM